MNQTPEQIPAQRAAAEVYRRHLIIDLRYAIDGMAERYADSRVDWTLSRVTGNPDIAARHSRAAKRQRKALQRLTSALANLAVGADQPRPAPVTPPRIDTEEAARAAFALGHLEDDDNEFGSAR